ncbi:MAG: hypothetical protein AAF990_12180 [Bacteroidota bacterium]
MTQQSSLAYQLELVWWFFTFLLAAAILYPILSKINDYPFLMANIVFIIIFVTFTRYVFLLRHTFLARRQWLKAIVLVLCLPILFYLVNQLNYFQTYLDEQGLESFMGALPIKGQEALGSFIRNEMLLFGVGSIFAAVLLPLRMILSIWRTHNRGTV